MTDSSDRAEQILANCDRDVLHEINQHLFPLVLNPATMRVPELTVVLASIVYGLSVAASPSDPLSYAAAFGELVSAAHGDRSGVVLHRRVN